MKKVISVLLVLAVMVGLVGCGEMGDIELETGENGIYINNDGSVVYGACEKFDKDYYDKDELEKIIDKEVEDFNKSAYASVKDAASVKSVDISKEKAEVVMNFITAYDFYKYGLNYNNWAEDMFYLGAVDDNDDVEIKGKFVDAATKKTVDKSEVEDSKDFLLAVEGNNKIQVDGEIKYYSKNCKRVGDVIIAKAKPGKLSYVVYDLED